MKIDPARVDVRGNFDLQHNCVVPRPVFLVSTVSEKGVYNLAPFSYFAAVNFYPPMLCFSVMRRDGAKMDTLRNIESNREFVVSAVTKTLAGRMHQCSAAYPPDVSEFTESGLTPVKGDRVKPALVAESPVNLECTLVKIVELGTMPYSASLVIGQTVLYHIADHLFVHGSVDLSRADLLSVLGGDVRAAVYGSVAEPFRMERPTPSLKSP